MTTGKKFLAAVVLFASLFAQPQNLLGCSVCYGEPDSGMAKGLVWGIAALLSVVVMVLAGVVTFFVHVGKRSASASGKASEAALESTDKVS
jgi:hypothetical protein